MITYNNFYYGKHLPPLLDDKETNELFSLVNKGSKEAKDKLIIHNIRLVIHIINGYYNYIYDYDEALSCGLMGLVKAVNTYDNRRENKFSTYATKCIYNEIGMYLRQEKRFNNIESFEKVIYCNEDNNELKLESLLHEDDNFKYNIEKKEINEIIRKLVYELPNRNKEIVMLYFGFYDDRMYTQEEIAEKLNISRSYVSTILCRTAKKFKIILSDMNILDINKDENTHSTSPKNYHRPVKTIYEYLNDYSKEEIDDVISNLAYDEIELIKLRYGNDLNNPKTSYFGKENSERFYGVLIPKMKRLLKKQKVLTKNKI